MANDPFDTGKLGEFILGDRVVDPFGRTVRQLDEADEETEETGYEAWTLKQLRAEAKNRNLNSEGTKSDLGIRLAQHDANVDAGPQAGAEDEEEEDEE